MSEYSKMTKDQLSAELNAVKEKYNEFKAMGLKLDMSRGSRQSNNLIYQWICSNQSTMLKTVSI